MDALLGDAPHRAATLLHTLTHRELPIESILCDLMARAEIALRTRSEQCAYGTLDLTLAVCRLRMLALELVHEAASQSHAAASNRHNAAIFSLAGDSLRFDAILPECLLRLAGIDVIATQNVSVEDVPGLDAAWQATDHHVIVLNDFHLLSRSTELIRCLRAADTNPAHRWIGSGRAYAAGSANPPTLGLDRILLRPQQLVQTILTRH
ncbi:MAG: hypothetical protein AAFX85_01620 [Pseudomonadota bacterium]